MKRSSIFIKFYTSQWDLSLLTYLYVDKSIRDYDRGGCRHTKLDNKEKWCFVLRNSESCRTLVCSSNGNFEKCKKDLQKICTLILSFFL